MNIENQVIWAGCVDYTVAWEWQKKLVVEKAGTDRPDNLILLEHPPVYTLGRSGRLENLLLDENERARQGIDLFWVDRGGDITYHGPGQLVGYPILDLKRLHTAYGLPRPDLHRYLRDIEEVVIQTLAHFNLVGRRYEGYTGVWVDTTVGPHKIAAIGVKVSSRGISSHGFALNVDPDLTHFQGIVPCGIHEHGVTSMAKLLQRPLAVTDLIQPLITIYGRVMQVETTFTTTSLADTIHI